MDESPDLQTWFNMPCSGTISFSLVSSGIIWMSFQVPNRASVYTLLLPRPVWFFSVLTLGRVPWEWLRTHIWDLRSYIGRNRESPLHVSVPLGISSAHWMLLTSLREQCEMGATPRHERTHDNPGLLLTTLNLTHIPATSILATTEEVLILEGL